MPIRAVGNVADFLQSPSCRHVASFSIHSCSALLLLCSILRDATAPLQLQHALHVAGRHRQQASPACLPVESTALNQMHFACANFCTRARRAQGHLFVGEAHARGCKCVFDPHIHPHISDNTATSRKCDTLKLTSLRILACDFFHAPKIAKLFEPDVRGRSLSPPRR